MMHPHAFLQMQDMAEYLGIDIDTESGLLNIARMAVAAPIPPGWQQLDSDDGFAVFRCEAACTQCMSLLSAASS